MHQTSKFERFIIWFKDLFISKKRKIERSNELKKQMCEQAKSLCNRNCESCAWHIEEVNADGVSN